MFVEQEFVFFSSRRRHTRYWRDWSSDVCSSDLLGVAIGDGVGALLTSAGTGIGALLITGLATGVAVGLLQWGLFLRGRLLVANLWPPVVAIAWPLGWAVTWAAGRSEEHTSELQSRQYLVCRLLLEKKKQS